MKCEKYGRVRILVYLGNANRAWPGAEGAGTAKRGGGAEGAAAKYFSMINRKFLKLPFYD